MVVNDLQDAMVEAIGNEMTFKTVPDTHREKSQKESKMRGVNRVLEQLSLGGPELEPHENVITQPMRKRDVPAVPEGLDIGREKREMRR